MLGPTISHYRILRELGAGGMGVVYEAEDTRLAGTSRVKFLSSELAKDGPMLERFEREARAASALNHPGICTVHAIEQNEGQLLHRDGARRRRTPVHAARGTPMEI